MRVIKNLDGKKNVESRILNGTAISNKCWNFEMRPHDLKISLINIKSIKNTISQAPIQGNKYIFIVEQLSAKNI